MKLGVQDMELLRRAVWKRKPSLMKLVDTLGQSPLTEEQREEIRGVLADELSEAGLREDDEPNEYGLRIDALIGGLRHF